MAHNLYRNFYPSAQLVTFTSLLHFEAYGTIGYYAARLTQYAMTKHRLRSITLLHRLSGCLLARFEQTENQRDLDWAIALARLLTDTFPHNFDGRWRFLEFLAKLRCMRYHKLRRGTDLERAIELWREAVVLRPQDHNGLRGLLDMLETCLQIRFELRDNDEGLEDIIDVQRAILALLSDGHPDRASSIGNLAYSLMTRHRRTEDTDDLDESIALFRVCLSLQSGDDPNRALTLSNLASGIWERYVQSDNMDDLDEAIHLNRDALALRPDGHPGRPASLVDLARPLSSRFVANGSADNLNEAVQLYRDALALLPDTHPDRSPSMCSLSLSLNLRFQALEHAEDIEECVQLLMQISNHTFSSVLLRLDAAYNWASVARRCDHNTTLAAYRTAISHFQRALMIRPDLAGRYDLMAGKLQYYRIGVDAASYAMEKGDLAFFVESLEQSRALLWSQMRGLRAPITRLSAVDKNLAERFADCCSRLESMLASSQPPLFGAKMSEVAVSRRFALLKRREHDKAPEDLQRLAEEQELLVNEIRQVPGFADFLQVPAFKELRQAASEGPIIMVNQSFHRCDVVVLLPREVGPCVCVPLDKDWFRDARRLWADLGVTRDESGVHTEEYDDMLRMVMKVLWDRVVSKVVQKLDEIGIPKGSRVWWCPMECLSFLPFHAAGPYKDATGATKYFMDDYISSYTPTLASLIAARSGTQARAAKERLLFVGDTSLKSTKKELLNIRKHRLISKCLLNEEAGRDSVTKALQKAEWVHFACHGRLDLDTAFHSSFVLPGGRLTLLDIARTKLPNAEFAFLSACHTAELSYTAPLDEALHMAAAMQFCGFRSVVGTMWQLLDSDGPILADAVYMHLMRDLEEGEIRYKRAAAAVREAALNLRSRRDWSDLGEEVEVMAERWVNLVHIGA